MGPITELGLKNGTTKEIQNKKRYCRGKMKNLGQSTLKMGTVSVPETLENSHNLMRLSVREDFIERSVSLTYL
jgi:hypothetical protein